MKKLSTVVCFLTLFVTVGLADQNVTSPNGKISVTVTIQERLTPYPAATRLYYSIHYNDKPVLSQSPFGLEFKQMPPLAGDLEIEDSKIRRIRDSWKPVWGTHAKIINACNELTLTLEEQREPNRRFQFIVRAFDDGVAFRYYLPDQDNMGPFELVNERTEFHFPANHTVWATSYPNYDSHQEEVFNKTTLADLQPGRLIGCPLLIQGNGIWMALTEANLTNWAGLYYSSLATQSNAVVSMLSPRHDDPTILVKSTTPRYSPWRLIMMGEKPGDLIESNIIKNLAEPLAIDDPSWIEPGISVWDRWWCGSYAPTFPGSLQVDNASMKYFIDFAAEMGWEYQLVDWYWYGNPFDPAKPFGTAGNPAVSILKQAEGIDIPELVRYGKEKGVKILIWLDWDHADQEMEHAFPLYEQWGVAGVKVDFMARDDQYMVNFYHRLVKLAAKHHLTVDFHGAYKPTGLSRTYPNLLTREGVLGNEYNKWSDRITPTHNVTLPFTRMLCGPMDYTPGGFRNKLPKTFRAVGSDAPGPFVMTTRAQQLAMMVVYDSPLQVLCDSPYNYRVSPAGLDFLKIVPTTWDDTRVLDGFPGEYIVMLRKSGTSWYLGAMTNEQSRSMDIPLDFLGKGMFNVTIWTDPDEAADFPDRLLVKQQRVNKNETLNVSMAGSGGYVAHFEPTR